MIELRNRFQYWRMQLCAKRGKEIKQQEFATFLGFKTPQQYNRYERHETQPLHPVYWQVWKKLREEFPDIHIEDLSEEVPN